MGKIDQSDQPIRQLVSRAQEGDREAFGSLVARYDERLRSSVQSWVRFRLGPALDSQEILQETFAAALEALPRFAWQGEDSFFLWLCGIAKRVVLSRARQVRRTGQLVGEDLIPGSGTSPSKALRREERFDRLQASVDALKPEYREVIRLARIEGLKVKQIAERMGKSPDAVKHLLARGLDELKRRFGETESFHLPDRDLRMEGGDHDE